jgi:hypothetical protein
MTFNWQEMNQLYAKRGGHPSGRSIEDIIDDVVTVKRPATKLPSLISSGRGEGWVSIILLCMRRTAEVETSEESLTHQAGPAA